MGLLKVDEVKRKKKEKNNDELNQFYKNLFSKNIINSNQKVVNYLKNIDTHKLLQ